MHLRTVFLGNMLLLTSPGLLVAGPAKEPALSVTGKADKRLESLDRMMVGFLRRHRLPGAAVAVVRHGRLVYARGFGVADPQTGEVVHPQSLFRIASLSKPVTAVAILQLVEAKRLKLDDTVAGVLQLRPEVDAVRAERVTIRQCLQHTGGWDRSDSFDPMFQSIRIARVLGTKAPAGPAEVIRFMQKWPLDFDPGTRYAYSNYGYCLLGRVIEKVSGETYESYVRKHVLKPMGVTGMRVGKTLESGRSEGEVRYHVDGEKVGLSVFDKDLGRRVSRAYGAWYLEAMDSHGGWIASAVDMARFASALQSPGRKPFLKAGSLKEMFAPPAAPVSRKKDGAVEDVYYGLGFQVRELGEGRMNQWHSGSLPGTSTLLVRRFDGMVWAVMFNSRRPCDGTSPASAIDRLVHEAVNDVQEWPEGDLFE
ncbi:MAG: serine hydrolase domain-containing protein [Planctomycetota bacterium]|nr:serine hydrolase domain-containing protein [Planctomycetota bacterium]